MFWLRIALYVVAATIAGLFAVHVVKADDVRPPDPGPAYLVACHEGRCWRWGRNALPTRADCLAAMREANARVQATAARTGATDHGTFHCLSATVPPAR